ncbi:MAG: hypothetical protein Q9174_000743 [Haloplaca sp. 1 TL-2023]
MASAMFNLDGIEDHGAANTNPTPPPCATETPSDVLAALGLSYNTMHTGSNQEHGQSEQAQSCVAPDLKSHEPCAVRASTPPVDIEYPVGHGRSAQDKCDQVRHLGGAVLEDQQLNKKLDSSNYLRKKSKRHHKQGSAMANVASDFTPTTSEDERSDFSKKPMRGRVDFARTNVGSLAAGQGCRSSSPGPGISALTQQLGGLKFASNDSVRRTQSKLSNLRIKTNSECETSPHSTLASSSNDASPTGSHSSATSESMKDGDSKQTISYEVALKHDFVSPRLADNADSGAPSPSPLDDMAHKMSASDFDPLRCLGKGTYGTVLLVKQARTGRLFAQKQFRKASLTVKQQLVEQTKTERAILESISSHPYVVKLFYAFQDQEKLYLILEYAQGGELFTRMLTEGMFPEQTAAFYMAEMVLALDHLHNTVGVVYRDLKPENCLLDADGHLLLTDFGLSKVAVDGDYCCRSMTGTLEYMAPEVLQQRSYGPEIDWWSFAVLGYEMLAGASPFHAKNDAKIQEKILKSKLVLPFFMSVDAKDLLTRLLRKKPKERLGARMPKDLGIIKGHRFFRKIDWKKLEDRQLEPPFRPIITDPEIAENFSTEFTDLALSPVSQHPKHDWRLDSATDPFQGFSFVASRSLLRNHDVLF